MEDTDHSNVGSEIEDPNGHKLSNLFKTVTTLESMVSRLSKEKTRESICQRQRSPSITGLENIYSDLCFTTSRMLGRFKYHQVSTPAICYEIRMIEIFFFVYCLFYFYTLRRKR